MKITDNDIEHITAQLRKPVYPNENPCARITLIPNKRVQVGNKITDSIDKEKLDYQQSWKELPYQMGI
jgi:hypothetical protein